LVALAPDVLLANGSPTNGPLLQSTRTIPIVYVQVADPIGAGDPAARLTKLRLGRLTARTEYREQAVDQHRCLRVNRQREEPDVQWKAAAFVRWHEADDARVSSPDL
jgi:hypothetical protein